MKRVIAAAVLSGCSVVSMAASVDAVNVLTQTEFEEFSKDLTAAFCYKAGAPAEPLGITGFDVGVSVSATDLKYHSVWDKAVSNGSFTTLVVPKLYLQKGLPFDIDVGAYYFTVPKSNLEAWGAELKYAIIGGNVALPAVAVRASATSLFGADQFKLDTKALDLSISKGILVFTPYAGVGRVWSTNTPQGAASTVGLQKFSDAQTRSFLGVSFSPGLINMAVERDSVGGIASYNFKLGVAF